MREKAKEILETKKVFAVIGVTQDEAKYGYEVFHTLKEFGYKTYPLNPKYEEIAGNKCYTSLKDLPESPEVIVLALAPQNTEKILDGITRRDAKIVWMPPGCWSERAVEKCRQNSMDLIYDVCPVGTLLAMKGGD